jgi:hypothetical protein
VGGEIVPLLFKSDWFTFIYVIMFFKLCWLRYGDSEYCSRKEVETAVAYWKVISQWSINLGKGGNAQKFQKICPCSNNNLYSHSQMNLVQNVHWLYTSMIKQQMHIHKYVQLHIIVILNMYLLFYHISKQHSAMHTLGTYKVQWLIWKERWGVDEWK